MHQRDLPVVEMHDTAGMPDQRSGIGGDEHLAFAQPEHHRGPITRDHDRVRPFGIEDGDRIRTRDEPESLTHRVDERVRRHRGDQVGEDLGIGVGPEPDALCRQPRKAGAVQSGAGVLSQKARWPDLPASPKKRSTAPRKLVSRSA
jgi:hypothetical protein